MLILTNRTYRFPVRKPNPQRAAKVAGAVTGNGNQNA